VVEIIEQVYLEIKNYGHEEQKKKLIAGIVLTGGGSQLKHLKQLVEYITGMDTRIGYPNEHLAGDSDPEIASPTYATAVGLLMKAVEHKRKAGKQNSTSEADMREQELVLEGVDEKPENAGPNRKERRTVLDKWADLFKEFLDNSE
jgi:cell division protein FtsA